MWIKVICVLLVYSLKKEVACSSFLLLLFLLTRKKKTGVTNMNPEINAIMLRMVEKSHPPEQLRDGHEKIINYFIYFTGFELALFEEPKDS